jgi:hypothetical protein
MQKGTHREGANPMSATRLSARPAPAGNPAHGQVPPAPAHGLTRPGRWAPGVDLLRYRTQSPVVRPPSALRMASMPGSVAQHRPRRASGAGSLRVGRGESCVRPPAVEALTNADPSGGWRCFPVGRAGTTGWSASELLSAALSRHSGRPHSRPPRCKVAVHPDLKVPLSMSAHALRHGVLRLVAAVLGATPPEPPSLADASTAKEGR